MTFVNNVYATYTYEHGVKNNLSRTLLNTYEHIYFHLKYPIAKYF